MSGSWNQSVGYPQSPDPTLNDPQWLQQLSHHPIFAADRRTSTDVAPRAQSMTVRGTDLIAVVDGQLRISSLVDAKAAVSGFALSQSPSSSSTSNYAMSQLGYKVLTSAEGEIPFFVRNLSVNPSGKLLACVGDSEVHVVVLPRSGYSKQIDRSISCRMVAIGPYYHSKHAETNIAKVSWHPWGEGGSSLLVLSDDGVLREYDVSRDTEEPQQSASFLPLSDSASRAGTPSLSATALHTQPGLLTAEDSDSTTAVSFSLCVTSAPTSVPTMFDQGNQEAWAATQIKLPADWSPLTVYGLMKNGDVWALCPFLPKNAVVPAIYIHSLASLTSLKANMGDAEQDDMQLRYLNALLRQTSPNDRPRNSVTPGPERLSRSRSGSAMDLDQLVDSSFSEQNQDDADQVHDIPVRLHPPSWSYTQTLTRASSVKKAPRPQGPFLLKPAPIELCHDRESLACDLVWTWLGGDSGNVQSVSGIGAIAVVGHDGRVDVGLVLESVEASWSAKSRRNRSTPARRSQSARPGKTNKYGLSDSDDEAEEMLDNITLEDGDHDLTTDLPCLLMYETINLGLLDTAQESGLRSSAQASDFLLTCSDSNRPCFVRDPLYQDTVYVYHALGAQCLSFAKWADKLLTVLNRPSDDNSQPSREQALVKLLHHGETTEVVWVVKTALDITDRKEPTITPVKAISVLSDVYLSYAFLAVTQDLQLVAIELSLRVDMDEATRNDSISNGKPVALDNGEAKPYVSLLGTGPAFQPPALFAQTSALQGLSSRARRTGGAGSSEVEITPETLRALGKSVESFRVDIRDVVSAGNAVQARLDLQVREMHRQLEKLNAIRTRCETLLGAKQSNAGSSLQARMQRISQTQTQLLARTDRALQLLMDRHQPDLSIYERKWFDELARIAAEVGLQTPPANATTTTEFGLDTRNKKSLASKADHLSYQLSLLRPQMQALASHRTSQPQSGLLGAEQLKKVEKMLSQEAAMLSESRAKIQELNLKIAQLQPAAVLGDRTSARSDMPTSSTTVNFGHYSTTSYASQSRIFAHRT